MTTGKIVLNAIVWVAKGDVSEKGVCDKQPALEDLEKNQDFEPPKNFDRDGVRKKFNLG